MLHLSSEFLLATCNVTATNSIEVITLLQKNRLRGRMEPPLREVESKQQIHQVLVTPATSQTKELSSFRCLLAPSEKAKNAKHSTTTIVLTVTVSSVFFPFPFVIAFTAGTWCWCWRWQSNIVSNSGELGRRRIEPLNVSLLPCHFDDFASWATWGGRTQHGGSRHDLLTLHSGNGITCHINNLLATCFPDD